MQGSPVHPTHRYTDHERATSVTTGRINAQFTPPARHDKTVLSVSCLVWRCELDDCSERVQTSNFLSTTVFSCRESSSHRRSRRDTDKTVLSCVAWRCELALTRRMRCGLIMMTRPDTLAFRSPQSSVFTHAEPTPAYGHVMLRPS